MPHREEARALARLSPSERTQLGVGKTVARSDWPRLRAYLLERSEKSNPSLRPDLTAYTPGETLALLDRPEIRAWHEQMSRFHVPAGVKTVVFVPCAKTKPWADASRGIYKSYNRLRKELKDVYFVTVSEPLGVVPQSRWGSFPQYDDPGLFRDPAQRSGLFTRDWKALFGVSSRLETPFDDKAYSQAIDRLAGTIRAFVENNRRPGLRFVSFVEDKDFRPDRTAVGTHSDMLTRADVVPPELRFKKRAAARSEPYEYLKSTLLSLGTKTK